MVVAKARFVAFAEIEELSDTASGVGGYGYSVR